jgi:hypothetical protein
MGLVMVNLSLMEAGGTVALSLREILQGGKKRLESLSFGDFDLDLEMNDADIMEICFFLPKLKEWDVSGPRFTLTIDGAREWKRICPLLETVELAGEERLTEEVKEEMKVLGFTVEEY